MHPANRVNVAAQGSNASNNNNSKTGGRCSVAMLQCEPLITSNGAINAGYLESGQKGAEISDKLS
jgi:hypothetical protein